VAQSAEAPSPARGRRLAWTLAGIALLIVVVGAGLFVL